MEECSKEKKPKTTLELTPDDSEHQQGFWERLKQRGPSSQPWATGPGFLLTDWRLLDGGSPSCYGNPDDGAVWSAAVEGLALWLGVQLLVVSDHQMQLKRWCFLRPASTTQHSRRRYAAAPEKHSWQLKLVAEDVNPPGSALLVGCMNPSEHLRDISLSGRGCWDNKLLSVFSQRQGQSCLQGCVLINAVVLERKNNGRKSSQASTEVEQDVAHIWAWTDSTQDRLINTA